MLLSEPEKHDFQVLLEQALLPDAFYLDERDIGRFITHDGAAIEPENPVTFSDRHLDPRLALKRVEIVPSLVELLSETFDDEIRAFFDAGLARPVEAQRPTGDVGGPLPNEPPSPRHVPACTAPHIANVYRDSLGQLGIWLASKRYFPDDADMWLGAFDQPRGTFAVERLLEICGPGRSEYAKVGFSAGSTLPDLAELGAHSPQLAVWDFYPANADGEWLIVAMESLPRRFAWDYASTDPADGGKLPLPLDLYASRDLAQGTFVSRLVAGKDSTAEEDSSAGSSPNLGYSHLSTPYVDQIEDEEQTYYVSPTHFAQNAWSRAVANDATFIVFSCGTYERIGVRDRASQTLYLSERIESANCWNPSQGKLHMGLHLAIVKDAVERQERRFNAWKASKELVRDNSESASGGKRKRSCGPDHFDGSEDSASKLESDLNDSTMTSPKRQKLEADESAEKDRLLPMRAKISSELSRRNFALINLSYGVYQSSTPSKFVRRGASSYSPGKIYESGPSVTAKFSTDQAFVLTLSPTINVDARNFIHPATVEVRMESGEVLKHSVIVKLVFRDTNNRSIYYDADDEDWLQNELSPYEDNAKDAVTEGISPIHGLFEDLDTGAFALIMEAGVISGFPRYIIPDAWSKERNVLTVVRADIGEDPFQQLRDVDQIWIQTPISFSGSTNGELSLYYRKGVLRKNETLDPSELHSQEASHSTAALEIGQHEDGASNNYFEGSSQSVNKSSACLQADSHSTEIDDDSFQSDSDFSESRVLAHEVCALGLQIKPHFHPIRSGGPAYYASVAQVDSENNAKHFSQTIVLKFGGSAKELQHDYDGHCRNPALAPYGLFTCADSSHDVLLLPDGGRTLGSFFNSIPDSASAVKQGYLNEIMSGAVAELHKNGLRHEAILPQHVVYKYEGQKRKFSLINYKSAIAIKIPPSMMKTTGARCKRRQEMLLNYEAQYLRPWCRGSRIKSRKEV